MEVTISTEMYECKFYHVPTKDIEKLLVILMHYSVQGYCNELDKKYDEITKNGGK